MSYITFEPWPPNRTIPVVRAGSRRELGTHRVEFLLGMNDARRKSLYWAKRIAAGTLVFRFAGTFDLIQANLGVINVECEIVLGIEELRRHRSAAVIPEPQHGRDNHQNKENADLFFLLHAAVRKYVFRCKPTFMTLAGPLFPLGGASVKDSTSYILGERCRPFKKRITFL